MAKRIVDAAKKEEDKMADERSAVEHHVIVSTLAPTQRGEGPGISISYCQAERGINNEVVINGAGPSIGTRAGIDNDVGWQVAPQVARWYLHNVQEAISRSRGSLVTLLRGVHIRGSPAWRRMRENGRRYIQGDSVLVDDVMCAYYFDIVTIIILILHIIYLILHLILF